MNCETARDLILEADLPALRGVDETDLARHIRGCPACRALAARIVTQTAVLAAGLDRLTARTPSANAGQLRRAGRRASVRRWAVALPLALAASLAVLLLNRPSGPPVPMPGPERESVRLARSLDVQVPQGQAITIFQTDNPDIVIIWSF